mmetsp:Transcript_49030/g.115203  ORF Transcript_49030/g.115203 Transcript_49030/m.115203 type:complete len:99 (-) Transcript_49030:366-662(-)
MPPILAFWCFGAVGYIMVVGITAALVRAGIGELVSALALRPVVHDDDPTLHVFSLQITEHSSTGIMIAGLIMVTPSLLVSVASVITSVFLLMFQLRSG